MFIYNYVYNIEDDPIGLETRSEICYLLEIMIIIFVSYIYTFTLSLFGS